MWETIASILLDDLTPLALVGIMVIMNYRLTDQSNKALAAEIKRLSLLMEKGQVESAQLNRVLSLYESAMMKITNTQEKIVTKLDQIVQTQNTQGDKVDNLTLTVYKKIFSEEMEKHEERTS